MAYLSCRSRKNGFGSFALPIERAGAVQFDLYATRAPSYGIIRVFLDGSPIGDYFDGYAPFYLSSGRIPLGVVSLAPGTRRLSFQAIGKNAASRGYNFSLDCIEVTLRPERHRRFPSSG